MKTLDLDDEALRKIMKEAFDTISQYSETGLRESKFEGERFIGLLKNEKTDGWRVDIASDGLNLNHKLAIENHLKHYLSNYLELSSALDLRFYFKRVNEAAPVLAPHSPKGPKPRDSTQGGPFGIQQRKRAIPGVRRVIAVSSGKGGVGKSTVSTNLAVSLAKLGQRVGLLDADIYGPSAPTMFGLSGMLPVNANRKLVPLEAFNVKCISFGFMSDEKNPVIWRGPMVSKALEQLFYDTEWGDLDFLIIDLPPGTGDVQLTMIERLPLFGGVLVSTPQNVALLDAHKGLTMFRKLKVPLLGIVENMSYFECIKCGHEEAIFGDSLTEFARHENIEVLARIPLRSEIRAMADEGVPVALQNEATGLIFRDLAQKLLDRA